MLLSLDREKNRIVIMRRVNKIAPKVLLANVFELS